MEHQSKWIEKPWLLQISSKGIWTLEGRDEWEQIVAEYLNAANGHTYWVCDVMKTPEKLDAPVFHAILQSRIAEHANVGAMVYVGTATMLKFLAAIATQQALLRERRVMPVFTAPTAEAAEALCRSLAASDSKLATESTHP